MNVASRLSCPKISSCFRVYSLLAPSRATSLLLAVSGFFLISCKSRTSNEDKVSDPNMFKVRTEQFFPKLPKVEKPVGFLTSAPEKADKEKCVHEMPEPKKEFENIMAKTTGKYKLVRSDYVPFCLNFRNESEGFPEHLQGIWWMNGNPLPEVLITFANSEWNNAEKWLGIKPNNALNWTWYAGTNIGQGKTDATVVINYDIEKLDEVQKMKSIQPDKNGVMKDVPAVLYDYTIFDADQNPAEAKKKTLSAAVPVDNDPLTVGNDALIRRTNYLQFLPKLLANRLVGDYTLTRIVDGNGRVLKNNYEAYLKFMADPKKPKYYSAILMEDFFPKK
jgi:hypothetical protein